MPIFRYKGYTSDGRDVNGSIEATGPNDAMLRVKAEGIFPSEVIESGAGGQRKLFRRTDESFLPNVTRQLSILLSSGVPLMEALHSLSAEHKGYYKEVLISIKERVSEGARLSKALEEFGNIFPEFYINMVLSGEQSGTLDKGLMRLADFLESRNTVRAKVRSAMIYPILMMGVSIVVLSFLFTFVIPKIVKIFNDTKAALPLITVILIFISNIFIKYWWLLFGAIIGIWVLIRRSVASHRLLVDGLILRLPGNVIQCLYYSRFARTLGFLLEGGLPMLKALGLSARSMGNRQLEATVLDAERRVAEGQNLSSTLEGFPPVFIQLISTGEKSGRLPESLNRAAQSYEEEFNRKVNRVVSLFEPAMILAMGLVVLFIVLAVLLPMFQLNQLIK
ncbi:MAG TPA: type II secretion system F family protein [Thermodesulfovibrionales bacterium]|nr:type II secretion system F family protein [Thermodesulfovibrionales bacterium]